jgi:rod shape-determining protein MreC
VARPRRSRRTLVTIAVLVLVSVTLITFDERSGTHHITSGLKSVAHDVFYPLTTGVNDILRPIGDFFAGSVHYGALQRENQQLEATIGQLREQVNETQRLRQEVQEFDSLNHVPDPDNSPTVTAEMINFDLSNFDADITIDKGRSEGVLLGDPVVAAGGLVGRVVEASHNTATVQLITDSRSSIPVSFGPSGQTYAIVDGQGPSNPLSVLYVPAQTPLHKGEKLYTNGLAGGEFPPNIPVGVVHSFRVTVSSGAMSVTMTPLANLDQLAYVEVLQWEPPL